jgi:hypothetical protein
MFIKKTLFEHSSKHPGEMRNSKVCLWLSIIMVGIGVMTASGAGNTNPTFHSFLTKDPKSPTSATDFSLNDRVSLQTIWTGLTGTHEEKVLWIKPNGTTYEKIQFVFTVPPGTLSYRTSACCLEFRKKRFLISPRELSYFGTWRAQLFLDNKLLSEYSFFVS